jgi:ribosome biogenesis protein UTP30
MPEKGRVKPYRIQLKHSIHPQDARVCLITKDPQQKYEELLKEKDVKRVEQVIGITQLRTKYKQHEAKRNLCAEFDVFLADDRIIPLLPRPLGKSFFKKKKLPIPIQLTKSNLKAEVMKAIYSTCLNIPPGTAIAVRIGHSGMKAEEIAENILQAVPSIVEKIPKKWKNILSLGIRTSDSVLLPFYHAPLEEPTKTNA